MEVLECPACGKKNRLSSVDAARQGFFRCGSCSRAIKHTERQKIPAPEPVRRAAPRSILAGSAEIVSRPFTALSWMAALALVIGVMPWAEGGYEFVRLLAFAAGAYGAFLAAQRSRAPWIGMLGSIAFLFNPLVGSLLAREAWMLIDLGSAAVLAAAPFYCLVSIPSAEMPKPPAEQSAAGAAPSL